MISRMARRDEVPDGEVGVTCNSTMAASRRDIGLPGEEVFRAVVRSPEDVALLEQRDPAGLLPAHTIYGALRHTAGRIPGHTAIIHLADAFDREPERIGYAEYLARVEQAANLFHLASEGEPPVVGVVAPFLPDALVAMWGGAVAGRYVPVNPFLEHEHVAGILAAAGATVLVIASGAAGPGVWSELDKLLAAVPTLKRCFVIGSANPREDFRTNCEAQPSGRLDFLPAQSGLEDCGFMHTGGTTATPKLVRHTHFGELFQAWLCGIAMGSDVDEVIGHAMPNFHLGGAVAKGLRAILFGQTLLTLTPSGFRNPHIVPEFWNIAEHFRMTSIVTAPTTAAALLAVGGQRRGPELKYTSGGSALPLAVAEGFQDRFGIALREVWGGTEFQGILSFHYAVPTHPRWGSCGRTTPFCGVQSAILDGDRFVRLAGPGERGILIGTAPSITPGFADPANDSGFFIQGGPDERQWATTGDVGHVDEDCFIWISGREKDVIIRGGHNIDSASIDDVLTRHPAVLYAAAVGQPCATRGELPMAFVEPKPGETIDVGEIMNFARANIAERAAVPVEIMSIEHMPLTAVGKVFKPPLRQEAIALVVRRLCDETGVTDPEVRVEEEGGKSVAVIRVPHADEPEVATLVSRLSRFTFPSRIEPAPARVS